MLDMTTFWDFFFFLIQGSFKLCLDKQEKLSQLCYMLCELYHVILIHNTSKKTTF